ncbi:hypothetical protein EWB00_000203 [Schistosoma japonicum]|uniref:Uncharacterized protein n=1 Tax=Schistosoma japonicum TaxID=6182 RepID=A0A4Z2CKC4_SCHJA|nr:hypothetical protein EWB00_000203 [Schistosoma japonicum]
MAIRTCCCLGLPFESCYYGKKGSFQVQVSSKRENCVPTEAQKEERRTQELNDGGALRCGRQVMKLLHINSECKVGERKAFLFNFRCCFSTFESQLAAEEAMWRAANALSGEVAQPKAHKGDGTKATGAVEGNGDAGKGAVSWVCVNHRSVFLGTGTSTDLVGAGRVNCVLAVI